MDTGPISHNGVFFKQQFVVVPTTAWKTPGNDLRRDGEGAAGRAASNCGKI
jgi:hypothetical protein